MLRAVHADSLSLTSESSHSSVIPMGRIEEVDPKTTKENSDCLLRLPEVEELSDTFQNIDEASSPPQSLLKLTGNLTPSLTPSPFA